MGSNAAENHPTSFKWVTKAQEKGATLIHVDPRFTRTSAKADIYAPLRSGTDIAFLGGMINYIIERKRWFPEYVANYTHAANIVSDKFKFEDGLFSGYDAGKRSYDKATWTYEMDDKGMPKRDMTLQDPRCVFQQMKKHYSRYTLGKVSQITGTPGEDLLKVYDAYTRTGQIDKSGTIMYAMGWTQHTVGVQNIRAMCIIQLLLGNMGVAGGGVNALRGESNVQGSTDAGLLFHILPGYLPTPPASAVNLASYNEKFTPKTKDTASLLKSFCGEAGTKENDFGYSWLPMADKEKGKLPFIMRADGLGGIFGPGLADGPFPEHYEPLECPVEKNLFSSQRMSPVAPVFKGEADAFASCDPRFPFVGTTYRVTEHWQPWLLEAMPQNFVEMSEELAKLRGIANGDLCQVSSARGKIDCVAVVTKRFKPFNVQGQTVHEVGLTWHFGWVHPIDGGDSANLLTPSTGDPNTRIPESKAFMVNVVKKGGK